MLQSKETVYSLDKAVRPLCNIYTLLEFGPMWT